MCGVGAREGENSWTRRSATACALFLRLCNAYGRERRVGYCEYETHLSTQFAQIANDKVAIRATDVALGLRRVPSGFHTIVHHSGLEWRTENKRSSANDDVVEWSGPIPM
jgi:hypothetical protein